MLFGKSRSSNLSKELSTAFKVRHASVVHSRNVGFVGKAAHVSALTAPLMTGMSTEGEAPHANEAKIAKAKM